MTTLPKDLPSYETAPPSDGLFDTPYHLTSDQLATFNEEGFLIVKDLFTDDSVKDLQRWSSQVHSWPNVRGAWMPYEETKLDGSVGLCRTEYFKDFHPGFAALFDGARMRGVLSQIQGEEMLLFKEKINYKAPQASGFDAHTDAPAYQHAGALKHLTINVAVDAATPDNGCLEVVRKSHKMNVPVGPDNCITSDWEQSAEWTAVPLSPGDTLIFGSFLAHRSGPNSTQSGRAAIYATFNAISDGGDKREAYYIARRKEFPPTFEREVGQNYELGALRYGFGSPMLGASAHSRMQKDRLVPSV